MLTKTTGLLGGSKISDSHQTVIEPAKPIIRAAKKLDAVTKVVIAELVHVGPGRQRIKFADVPAGLKVTVRGGILQQVLYLYTVDRETVRQEIQQVWQSSTT
ncbi:hypothetical protein HZC53_00180 [Candidatus Uhrbacteria bacterium]|nr:hypothetical protein [Candidatus Uhrbacteria bacterium]